ncbi:RB-associated KRAB zinc finger protein-like [Stegodyphus dumicola]|uniref:RB-associated KRAB zinc finger protein-like n=1 Tax=Stegodyphus dumicola TaxID=202533 RepID=UPI0015A87018|nr:RB-associated KRAB zinc finger protein-like [Stegodyphus dumicola]
MDNRSAECAKLGKSALNGLKIKYGAAKAYECNICKKVFVKKWSLNAHIKFHSGKKPYKCDDHFEESQFASLCKDRKKLRKTALPTLFSIPNPPPSVTDKRIREIRCPKPNTQLGGNQMTKVHSLDALDRNCCLLVDEMEIASYQDFDTSSKSFIGNVTLGKPCSR